VGFFILYERTDLMNNLQRLEMEVSIKLEQDKLIIYFQENGLQPFDEYNPSSNTNKKKIYQSALSILESIANNPTNMKSYKLDDMTVSDFHENLMNRIDQLERKIRNLKTDEQLQNESNFFMLFAD
jgi:DNA polymerase II small subunit/DNA polymerase delta subunit B